MNKSIATALLAAQKEMGDAVKSAKNPFFKSKFADLNSVREAVMPALNNAGITVLQPTVIVEGRSFVRTVLLHESGESFTSDTEILVVKQNDPQALGSAISYARRYGLQSLMCVGAIDDDGEGGMGRHTPQQTSKVTSTEPQQTITTVTVQPAPAPQPAEPAKQAAPVSRSSFNSKPNKPVVKTTESSEQEAWRDS